MKLFLSIICSGVFFFTISLLSAQSYWGLNAGVGFPTGDLAKINSMGGGIGVLYRYAFNTAVVVGANATAHQFFGKNYDKNGAIHQGKNTYLFAIGSVFEVSMGSGRWQPLIGMEANVYMSRGENQEINIGVAPLLGIQTAIDRKKHLRIDVKYHLAGGDVNKTYVGINTGVFFF